VRRLLVVLGVGVLTAALAPGFAEAATRTAKIPAPEDGNVTVAHVVVKANLKKKLKKGAKKPKPPRAPKAKVVKAPAGLVAASSFKRDAKNKNRFHATVVVTNPVGAPASPRSLAGMFSPAQAETLEITFQVVRGDTIYVFVVELTEVIPDATYTDVDGTPPWIDPFCDPPTAAGDAYFYGMPPAGLPATRFIDDGCFFGGDAEVEEGDIKAMVLAYIYVEDTPFPGVPTEYVITFELINITGADAVAFTVLGGNRFTGAKPPPGYGCAPNAQLTSIGCGRARQPFAPNQDYMMNMRFQQTPADGYSQFSTNGGQQYMPTTGMTGFPFHAGP